MYSVVFRCGCVADFDEYGHIATSVCSDAPKSDPLSHDRDQWAEELRREQIELEQHLRVPEGALDLDLDGYMKSLEG